MIECKDSAILHSYPMEFLQNRVVFQETPEGGQPEIQSQAPENKEVLLELASEFQEAIDQILPRVGESLEQWKKLNHDSFTYAGDTYHVKFIDKSAGRGKRLVGLSLSTAERVNLQTEGGKLTLPEEHILNALLHKQIAIYRIDNIPPSGDKTSSPYRYQMLYDPLKLTFDFAPGTGELFLDTRGKKPTERELRQALQFVSADLRRLMLAARMEHKSEEE